VNFIVVSLAWVGFLLLLNQAYRLIWRSVKIMYWRRMFRRLCKWDKMFRGCVVIEEDKELNMYDYRNE
jgi:hypothetical protein